MEIKAMANGEFLIKYENGKVSIDPQSSNDANLTLYTRGDAKFKKGLSLDWPGEYEAENVLCTSIQVLKNEKEHRVLSLEIEGFRVAFMGKLNTLIPDKIVKNLSAVEILVLPLSMSVKDMQVLVEEIEPNVTLIVKDDSYKDSEGIVKYEKYLKILGQENIEPLDSLKIKKKDELEDLNNFIVLNI